MPLGEVIEKFLAAKSNRSAAYMDKLNADMRLFQAHFAANRPIDRITSDEIEDFLDSKKAASRRRNNLRSEIITQQGQPVSLPEKAAPVVRIAFINSECS